jgi:hypothetical protein
MLPQDLDGKVDDDSIMLPHPRMWNECGTQRKAGI